MHDTLENGFAGSQQMTDPPRMQLSATRIAAACYFVYTAIAAAILFFVVAVNSQGNSGNISLTLIFAIALTSPLPMLFVGFAFLRHWRWAVLLALVVALAQALGTAQQSHIAGGHAIAEPGAGRAALFYLCASQTFYLPGSLFLAPLSALTLLRRKSVET